MSEAKEKTSDAQNIHTWATERIAKQRLPLPAKLKFPDPEFSFPEDPEELTSVQLGQMMLRFAGWFAYSMRLLGIADSEYSMVEAEYRLRINQLGLEERKELGRLSADVIEAAVLKKHGKELGALRKRKLELYAVKMQLEPRLKIYEKLHYALSRELSRRESDTRIGQQGRS